MPKRAQYWENLIHITGGKLNFSRCYYYLVLWGWDSDGRPSQLSIDDNSAELQLMSSGNMELTLIQLKRNNRLRKNS